MSILAVQPDPGRFGVFFSFVATEDSDENLSLFDEGPFRFGPSFLKDHAGHVFTDPHIALVELIANSYDAGATEVRIKWPEVTGEIFEISDNGAGMTKEQFDQRWRTFSYSRRREQGPFADVPAGTRLQKRRVAFGQTGKGRHGAFCFSNEYLVDTWRDGNAVRIRVSLTEGGQEPFHCSLEADEPRSGHGTRISARLERNALPVKYIREAVGSKFLVDPDFRVIVNREQLELVKLGNLQTEEVTVEPYGTIQVHLIESVGDDRTTHLRGITWWVNGRMVGQPDWGGLDKSGAVLDGRTSAAKRYSFVVMADVLQDDVKSDWTGFHASERSNVVTQKVRDHVIRALENLVAASRKAKKLEALKEHKSALRDLPSSSQRMVGQFAEEVVQKCPSVSQGDLVRTVEIFANMEKARSGYDLLARLAACSPDDLDTWNTIMKEWSARDAEIVLTELQRRLQLIAKLQDLVHSTKADELHDLQPLFERGLWMFGPEYEAVDFRSNRSMATIIRKFLKAPEPGSSRRPDFVALPDTSIGIYAAAAYEDAGEISGFRKVLIVELKKGGFLLTQKEVDQARDYAKELRAASKVDRDTIIVVYILGAELESGLEKALVGEFTHLIPMDYDTLLARAHSRTFNLQKRLEEARITPQADPEVQEALGQGTTPLFDQARNATGA